ncbi:MAG: hypothetical protein RLZZ174_849 [Pseudomonadota bacterium]|jgi:cytochrome c553|nr:cytochrome c [Pseudomonadota bacterium]
MVKSLLKLSLIASACILLAACDRPADDVATLGAQLAEEKGCLACHGLNGKGTAPTFPNINGQWPSYLHKQLEKYRSGERQNMIMSAQAKGLSDQDIKILSRFYAAQ